MARADLNGARSEIEECLSLYPDHPEAKIVRNEIEHLIVDDASIANELVSEGGSASPNVTRYYLASAALCVLAIILGYDPIMYCLEHGFNSTVYLPYKGSLLPFPAHIGLFFSTAALAGAVMVAVQARCIILQAESLRGRSR